MESSHHHRKPKLNLCSARFLLCFLSLSTLFFILFRPSLYPDLPAQPVQPVQTRLSDDPRTFYYKIDDRVRFPDHILVLGSKHIQTSRGFSELDVIKDVFSVVDDYHHVRWLARAPLPPANSSSRGQTMVPKSWDHLAYEAMLDRSNSNSNSNSNSHSNSNGNGNTVVVFVKGISHRQDKESDPTRFTCHFGLTDGSYVLTSRALTVAQEVVRCVLPRSLESNPERALGIRVTVGFRMPVGRRGQDQRVLMVPSVAQISSFGLEKGAVKHELCVCTMLWNQAGSLREWMTYHSWLGVERWFIYDNNSDDEIQEVVRKMGLEGFNVSRHVWPWIKTQEAGFSHCAVRARDECTWVSFMDVDEFYYFPRIAAPGSLKTLVSNYTASSVGELRTSCHSFGPSGLTAAPKQGVTVGYTCRLKSPERHKSIIRPEAINPTLMNVVHHFHLRKGFRSVNVYRSTAVINHYKYQVWEAFRAKFYRRVATYVADWQDKQNEGSRDRAPGLGREAVEPSDWRLRFCEVRDTGLRDLVLANLADVSTGLLPWDV